MQDYLKKQLDLRLDIYFSLTKKQQREFNKKFQWQFLENVSLDEMRKITKSKVILAKLQQLRINNIRLVA